MVSRAFPVPVDEACRLENEWICSPLEYIFHILNAVLSHIHQLGLQPQVPLVFGVRPPHMVLIVVGTCRVDELGTIVLCLLLRPSDLYIL